MIHKRYMINCDGLPQEIIILGEDNGVATEYKVIFPELKEGSESFIKELSNELLDEKFFDLDRKGDTELTNEKRKRKIQEAREIIKNKIISRFKGLDEYTINFLISKIIWGSFGFGQLEIFLNDDDLEEIIINGKDEPVRVYHKKFGWLESSIRYEEEIKINADAQKMARLVGRQLNELNPILDAQLPTGDRVNVVMRPIATKGTRVTIRKFRRAPWTVIDFAENNTLTTEVIALTWLCLECGLSILVSGGTGSGKTSILGAFLIMIPPKSNILSIEDTPEIKLHETQMWTPLITKQANAEGRGEVAMHDLLVSALRMRPDAIVVGEIRRKKEAQTGLEAANTGHSIYGTVHADSAQEVIDRMTDPEGMAVSAQQLKAIDLVVIMSKVEDSGGKAAKRTVSQIAEFQIEKKVDKTIARPHITFVWDQSTDRLVRNLDPLHLYDKISTRKGFSKEEIQKDLAEKKKILEWMIREKKNNITDVGKIFQQYYLNKNNLPPLKDAKKK